MKKYALPFIKLYWRIFRPKTFGVKVIIRHPVWPDEFLVVRHTYGNNKVWNLPGGGYQPKKESELQAGIREVREELNLDLLGAQVIGKYYTTVQGKRDTVTFLKGTVSNILDLKKSDEVAEFAWVHIDQVRIRSDFATIVKEATKHFTT